MVAIQIMLESLLNEHGLYFDKKKLQSDLILIRKWKSFAKPGDVRDKETILYSMKIKSSLGNEADDRT
ncbi:hypothetical protein [Streptococcus orisratti]